MSNHSDDLKELDALLAKIAQHRNNCMEAVAPYATMGLDLPADVLDRLQQEGEQLRTTLQAALESAHDPRLKAEYADFIKTLDGELAALKNRD